MFERGFDTLMMMIIIIIAVSTALTTFGSATWRQAVRRRRPGGRACRQALAQNLMAGVQIAITRQVRIEDAVIIENEGGWVEAIASSHVVIGLWDWRGTVVGLRYFMEKPFQNWTRRAASLIGSGMRYLAAAVPQIRSQLKQVVRDARLWDDTVVNLQLVDANSRTIELLLESSGRATRRRPAICAAPRGEGEADRLPNN